MIIFLNRAHYESTAPEIWEQTEGKLTHFVVGEELEVRLQVAELFQRKSKEIKVIGVDTYGSILKEIHETQGNSLENALHLYYRRNWRRYFA